MAAEDRGGERGATWTNSDTQASLAGALSQNQQGVQLFLYTLMSCFIYISTPWKVIYPFYQSKLKPTEVGLMFAVEQG